MLWHGQALVSRQVDGKELPKKVHEGYLKHLHQLHGLGHRKCVLEVLRGLHNYEVHHTGTLHILCRGEVGRGVR